MTDLSPEESSAAGLPRRRQTAPGLNGGVAGGSPLPQRTPFASPPGAGAPGDSAWETGPAGLAGSLPRRTSGPKRVGRHRSVHRISVASDAPVLVIAVPGPDPESAAELAEHIAESTAESCPGVDIRIGYLSGPGDSLADALAGDFDRSGDDLSEPAGQMGELAINAPRAVVVPLLAGPHPVYDAAIAEAVDQAAGHVMLATALGPHPLLACALHDRLSEVGLARASRARGLNISSGANGVIVVADRGPLAISDAGVTSVLLAARLAIPVVPASFGDPASINAALERLRDAGATYPAIAPCVIGPELDPAEFVQLSEALNAPCAQPLGGHPAVAQLVSVRYGEALARISVASH